MNFNISDKLICVDDIPKRGKWQPNGHVKKGCVYVVEGHMECSDKVGLLIVGHPIYTVMREDGTMHEPRLTAWDPDRFRLLSEVQAEARREATHATGLKVHASVKM